VRGHHVPILKAWNLSPVTLRTWVKDRIGRGQVLRGQTEHMIIAIRGKPTIEVGGLATFFHAAIGKEHSEKPPKSYDDFEKLVPAPRYFELFARRKPPENWDGHGDQVGRLSPAVARQAEMGWVDKAVPKVPGWAAANSDAANELLVLEAIALGEDIGSPAYLNGLAIRQFIMGKRKKKLTQLGEARLNVLRAAARGLPLTAGGLVQVDAAHKEEADARSPDDPLAVMEAIAAGESFGSDKVLANLQRIQWIEGKRKKKITHKGEMRLEELREERDAEALPEDIEQLIELYRATLAERHAAALAVDKEAASKLGRMLDLLQMKANGGKSFGMATDESAAERLRKAAAAPIGTVPMWGQRGVFQIDVDGTPYLCSHDETCSFAVHAVDPDKPFISNTGYMSLAPMAEMAFGVTVEDQFRGYISEHVRKEDVGATGKRKPRKKPMPLPENVYAVPESWSRPRNGEPKSISKTAARKAIAAAPGLPTGEGGLVEVDGRHLVAPSFVTPNQVREEEAAAIARLGAKPTGFIGDELHVGDKACRVCECTEDNACPGGCAWSTKDPGICTACEATLDHVVSMCNPSGDAEAVCGCGKFHYRGPWEDQAARERAVIGHWRDVVAEATGLPPAMRRRGAAKKQSAGAAA
jgi:hypothetical protein